MPLALDLTQPPKPLGFFFGLTLFTLNLGLGLTLFLLGFAFGISDMRCSLLIALGLLGLDLLLVLASSLAGLGLEVGLNLLNFALPILTRDGDLRLCACLRILLGGLGALLKVIDILPGLLVCGLRVGIILDLTLRVLLLLCTNALMKHRGCLSINGCHGFTRQGHR